MADSLRSFRSDDRQAVLELSRHALARPEEQVGNPVWETLDELDSELAGWDRPPAETLVVEEESGAVVGFGGVEIPAGWEHADLFGPLVAEEFRGRRIGSRLLEASIEAGHRNDVRRIVGSVGNRNARGRLLLERAGFKALGGARAAFRLSEATHRPVAPQPELAVRPGRPEDLEAALSLYHECFPRGQFPEDVWRAGLERGTVYLAERDGRILAFVDIDPSDRWIYHLGVTETERSRGVGAALLSRSLQNYWETHPGEWLGLAIPAQNVPAIRLFRRQGFVPWLVLQSLELRL